MTHRPNLDTPLDNNIFPSYYYLKSELVAFCKANNLPTSGGKIEITERISHYLNTGETAPDKHPTVKHKTTIDQQFEYNTYIRDFFADNRGHSLNDAIKCWHHKKSLPRHNRYESNDLAVLKRE